jgi:hypothetical protein
MVEDQGTPTVDYAPERGHKRDHRAALQAEKLRMKLATKAICFGEYEPLYLPKRLTILVTSVIIACIILVGTIAAAKIIQML